MVHWILKHGSMEDVTGEGSMSFPLREKWRNNIRDRTQLCRTPFSVQLLTLCVATYFLAIHINISGISSRNIFTTATPFQMPHSTIILFPHSLWKISDCKDFQIIGSTKSSEAIETVINAASLSLRRSLRDFSRYRSLKCDQSPCWHSILPGVQDSLFLLCACLFT